MDQSDLRTRAPELDESGELYRLIAETIPQIVWSSRVDGSDDFHNARASEYSGLDASQLAGTGWQAMVHPEDLAPCLETWAKSMATGEPFLLEYRLRRKDGAWRWHLAKALPLRDRDGRIVRWFGTATDIDDQKRAAERLEAQIRNGTEALRESAERYRQLIEVAPVAIFVHSAGRIVMANPAMVQLFRAESVEQLIGREVLDLIAPGSRDLVRGRIRQLYETPQSVPLTEVEYVRLDGTQFSVEATAVSFTYAGRPAAQVVARDITGRKAAERALRESEQRFRALTELSSDWYWEQDAELRFVGTAGRSALRAGISEADHIGKRHWELPRTEILGQSWDEHRAALAARAAFRDLILKRAAADGSIHYISVSGEPRYDARGGFAGYHGVATDVTARYRVELALRESSEKYEGLVGSIDGIVWEADPATFAFHFVSDQAERLLGYPPYQWLEEPDFWRKHTHPEDAGWAAEYCARSTAQKRNHEFEYRMIAADGRTVWLRDLVAVVVEHDVVVKLRGIMVDVTDRRSAEQALRKSEERFRALTALSSDFYWETDREHRFVMMEYGKSFRGPMPSAAYLGKRRWETPSVAPNEDGWRAYRETVDAHRPVRGFGFARLLADGEIRHYEVDGDPLFEPSGAFLGYRGVGRDVSDRLRAERALQDSERRVRALLRRLTATQEAERRRIAADLHDFVGQNLTALGIGLETLRSATPAEAAGRQAPTFDEMRNLLKDTMDTVRQTMSVLRPPLLDDYGLVAALESHARQFSLRTGLAVAVQGQRIAARPAPNVELALFRIAQEALANAVKHAGASRAEIALSSKGGFLRLSIEDNGGGFAQPSGARAEDRGGWGLPMMRERAEEAGGTLRIEFPAKGTRVVAEVPHVDSNHPG